MEKQEVSFIRWQSIAINQLGYANGLILTFAAASLGFALGIIKDVRYVPGCWSKAFMLLSCVSLLLSVSLGLVCIFNRLSDFRLTARIARVRETQERDGAVSELNSQSLEELRMKVKKVGENTWRLFLWQLGTFVLGVLALVVAFGIAFRTSIF